MQSVAANLVLVPIRDRFYDYEESYKKLCESALNTREKTGKLPKSKRHEFYATFIENFDDLLMKRTRGEQGNQGTSQVVN